MITTGGSRRSPGTMRGKPDRDDSTGGRQTRCYRKKPYAVLGCLHALRGMSRYWTAQPAGSSRFLDHGNPVSTRPWEPTVPGPPITPGTPRSRCDLTEPPPLAVHLSQHALALLRLPACDGRRCLAHAAVVQILCAALTIPSVDTSGNQCSTDLSVRFGLARVSASALHGVPCAPQSAATSLRIGSKARG
jgi:hypothetical protein